MNKNLFKSGYSLIEAVIAVSVLAVVISTGLTIILTATSAEETNQDFLIGNMLAIEGAERVQNIYYTNILKFGVENVRECGFVQTRDTATVDDCAEHVIKNGTYLLEPYDSSSILNWKLTNMLDATMVVGSTLYSGFQLYTAPQASDLSETDNFDVYLPSFGTVPSTYTATEFHREILISGYGTDSIGVTSRVGWLREDGKVRTIRVEVTLPLVL